jgi:hypothetical protein
MRSRKEEVNNMNNETFLDFCFIRELTGSFSSEIGLLFENLFKGQRLHWYLEEKTQMSAEIVVAQVKGMSRWTSETKVINFLEENAGEEFWTVLQGYKIQVFPAVRGCCSCG